MLWNLNGWIEIMRLLMVLWVDRWELGFIGRRRTPRIRCLNGVGSYESSLLHGELLSLGFMCASYFTTGQLHVGAILELRLLGLGT